MNRAAIRQRILTALNESPDTPVFFGTTEIDAVIDEGMEVICEYSEAIKRTSYLPLLPGTTYYSLQAISPRAMCPWRIWLPSQNRRLAAVSIGDLDQKHQTWPTTAGEPWNWFPVSWDTFGLYPHPSEGGGMIRVDHLEWPAALANDTDQPELLEGDHEALVLYGLYDGSAKRWDLPTCLQTFSLFMQRIGASVDKTGAGRLQARSWQIGQPSDITPLNGVAI